jgi:hypothetical protein
VASSRFPSSSVLSVVSHTHTPAAYTKQKISNPKRTTEISHMVVDENNKNMGPSLVFNFLLFFFSFIRKEKKNQAQKRVGKFSVVVPPFFFKKLILLPIFFVLSFFVFTVKGFVCWVPLVRFRGSNNKQQNVYQIRA